MSWRELLAALEPSVDYGTQNPQFRQNRPANSYSANCADSALDETELMKALVLAASGLRITPEDVFNPLASEDIEEWRRGSIGDEALSGFAKAVEQRREMDDGKVPSHWTKIAHCKGCGPIWLWFSGEVLGCPWCWTRAAGRSVPRAPAKAPSGNELDEHPLERHER